MSEEKRYLEMLDALTESLGSSEDQSLEEVTEELIAEGIDVDASISRLMQTVGKCTKAARRQALDRAREERLRTEQRSSALAIEFANLSKARLLKMIREIMSAMPDALSLSFRDLESKSDEDLASILEDLELAKQLAVEEQSHDE